MNKIKQEITFKDFLKVDIRVGTVLEAEKVEGSDKLIKMQFDFGEFKRQIVAGIATKYTTDELIGKQLPVLVNLQPRLLMGLNSQGMILAIGDRDIEALLHPSERIKKGSSVH